MPVEPSRGHMMTYSRQKLENTRWTEKKKKRPAENKMETLQTEDENKGGNEKKSRKSGGKKWKGNEDLKENDPHHGTMNQ